jgi:protein associated with RNAse G/E
MGKGPWAPSGSGEIVRVMLQTHKGVIRHTWEASLDAADDHHIIVRAVATKELVFPNITINRGDPLIAYFPRTEWFYIQKYLSPSGRVKGWYCNIGTPVTFEDRVIKTQDLIMDLFVNSNGEYRILDEEEFEMERRNLQNQTIQRVMEAKHKLIRMIETQQFPFIFEPKRN